ncbi:N-methylhydantoinase B/acetone carboxylase, alpha subunit [Acidianus hospitalis W1]|uniref:N-methylhydantoinase B/acetone carboxylase, alpha subunit n=1 Tax=Acidianus hospitalis (strain W1) TaxID=933801 RepID=F4B449_ACIHW|nr:hydantoinase B/oxoprolinase family protein [Acidianus hospitalis]AEE93013.1 N-methylhydantoinase B/acetone carboxylase, alpha subunit [Acidianus hospitalis W1]
MKWEIVHKATSFIAEEMGVSLKKSALSPNIRERMDHSCAIVNEEGKIVAQAEHIPVHLGSFKIGVLNVLNYLEREGIELEEGDSIIFNDPYISGTHLNDVGVLSPIFYNGKLVGYAVNKAHHVDVGGPLPGSINPTAKTIYEEGVVIPPVKLTRKGSLNDEIIKIIKENFKVPDFSLGDIKAQISANKLGEERVRQLFEKYGDIRQSWEESIDYSRRLALNVINTWKKGEYEAEDYLEWGSSLLPIKIKLQIEEKGIIADFEGTHKQIEGPLNAVLGVTYSAVSFAVRSMVGEVPTNDGFYSLITVKAEEGSLVNPLKPAAVGGGNVETSQRIADVTFLAMSKFLKVPAAASGTMMNIMMGSIYKGKYWSYYETVGGGSGGRPCKDGVAAVQNNMTNTLNTPIEIAERQYPILFIEYRIREGSGGNGLHKGGDGIIRGFKLLSKAKISILADRFKIGPWGLEGGERGKPGRVTINGKDYPSKFTEEVNEGDVIIVETPGGGGYGKAY